MPLPKSPTIENYFPVREVSEKSKKEKDNEAPIFDMLFWWTRKPLTACRAVIGGAITEMNPEEFKRAIALERDRPYEVNPSIKVEGIKLLDPFAGGGSIPFEALRMGIDITAVELLPVAYITYLINNRRSPRKKRSIAVGGLSSQQKKERSTMQTDLGHVYQYDNV